MIKVAGVPVPRAAISRLALRLQNEGEKGVAYRLGHAIDHNLESLALTPREIDVFLAALRREPVEELEALREKLSGSPPSPDRHLGGVNVDKGRTVRVERQT